MNSCECTEVIFAIHLGFLDRWSDALKG
jgi:hypothetical protein